MASSSAGVQKRDSGVLVELLLKARASINVDNILSNLARDCYSLTLVEPNFIVQWQATQAVTAIGSIRCARVAVCCQTT